MPEPSPLPRDPILTPDVFSVPRRFDMATILVAMLGYALLFAGLGLIPSFPPVAMGLIGTFFAVVAVGQAVAIRWNRPRTASIIAGTFFWLVTVTLIIASSSVGPCEVCGMLFFCFVFGPICGYLAGTLVGGVFLISHHLREANLLRRRSAQSELEAESPWDAQN